MKIRIYGASDDLVEVEGCKGEDEFQHYNGVWRGDLISPDGGQLRLHVLYDGCWHIAVGLVEEDVPLPGWPMEFGADGYSTVLVIDAPDSTRLTNVGKAAVE